MVDFGFFKVEPEVEDEAGDGGDEDEWGEDGGEFAACDGGEEGEGGEGVVDPEGLVAHLRMAGEEGGVAFVADGEDALHGVGFFGAVGDDAEAGGGDDDEGEGACFVLFEGDGAEEEEESEKQAVEGHGFEDEVEVFWVG